MAHERLALSESQRAAVKSASTACVVSCPGSGKTRTIVAKLLSCLEEIRGTARRIGCITYTNAGVYEIDSRVLEVVGSDEQANYEVSTIHSFCLRHIVCPYGYLIPELCGGFAILAPEDELFTELMQEVVNAHHLTGTSRDSFSGIQRLPGGEIFCSDEVGQAAALDFIERVASRGYRTLPDIVYYAGRILEMAPFVARSLGSAFAWMLVDEFQDTSAAQVEILSRVAQVGRTMFFLVGDPNQSIMSFAGARPDLMAAFAAEVGSGEPLPLAGNYRSSRRIVALAERLCPSPAGMEAVGPNSDYDFDPIYVEAASAAEAVLQYFLPAAEARGVALGEMAVLAPRWFELYPLGKRLRREGVPIFGPGARPYRRRLLFAPFAEEVCAYLESHHPANVVGAQRALFHLLEELTGESQWSIFSYEGRVIICHFLHAAGRLRRDVADAEGWLRGAVDAFASIMVSAGLLGAGHVATIRDSAEEMIEGLRNDAELVAPVGVEHLGLFATPQDCLRLMTLHASKGREFDAVALIDLHERRIPNWRAQGEQIDEARRLLYVGVTRARKLLMLFTDRGHWRNQPTRFLRAEGLGLV